MNAKFREITDNLNALISFGVDKSMTDDDFIANIDAFNLLCNTYDDLDLDRSEIRSRMDTLYPELIRRVNAKKYIQLAMPLVKALYTLIYGRADDRGPTEWRDSLNDMCSQVVDSYRNNPLIHSSEYLFALSIVCRQNLSDGNPYIKEYKEIITNYLEDIGKVTLPEKIRRVWAYERARQFFSPDNLQKWAELCASLTYEDISRLDDATFILWREITDESPLKELKKRSVTSLHMQIEYLQSLIHTEFTTHSPLIAS